MCSAPDTNSSLYGLTNKVHKDQYVDACAARRTTARGSVACNLVCVLNNRRYNQEVLESGEQRAHQRAATSATYEGSKGGVGHRDGPNGTTRYGHCKGPQLLVRAHTSHAPTLHDCVRVTSGGANPAIEERLRGQDPGPDMLRDSSASFRATRYASMRQEIKDAMLQSTPGLLAFGGGGKLGGDGVGSPTGYTPGHVTPGGTIVRHAGHGSSGHFSGANERVGRRRSVVEALGFGTGLPLPVNTRGPGYHGLGSFRVGSPQTARSNLSVDTTGHAPSPRSVLRKSRHGGMQGRGPAIPAHEGRKAGGHVTRFLDQHLPGHGRAETPESPVAKRTMIAVGSTHSMAVVAGSPRKNAASQFETHEDGRGRSLRHVDSAVFAVRRHRDACGARLVASTP